MTHQSGSTTAAAAAIISSQRFNTIVMLSMVLLLLLACRTADARPETLNALSASIDSGVGVRLSAPLYMTRTAEVPTQAFWRELLQDKENRADERALYTQLKKYQQRHGYHLQQQQQQQQQQQHQQQSQPNYLAKWPGLRDLLLTADYDDDVAVGYGAANAIESNELVNTRFVERLRELAASAVDDLEDARADNYAPEVLPETATAMPLSKPAPSAPGNNINFKEHGIKKNVQLRKQYMSPCHFKICNMGRKRNARFYDD